VKKKLTEQQFIEQWWARRFPKAEKPDWNSAITCTDAIYLLRAYQRYLKGR
jgi:hypothetical protein